LSIVHYVHFAAVVNKFQGEKNIVKGIPVVTFTILRYMNIYCNQDNKRL